MFTLEYIVVRRLKQCSLIFPNFLIIWNTRYCCGNCITNCRFRGYSYLWFDFYLLERFEIVRTIELSSTDIVGSGIPQGSVLEPLLFLLCSVSQRKLVDSLTCEMLDRSNIFTIEFHYFCHIALFCGFLDRFKDFRKIFSRTI